MLAVLILALVPAGLHAKGNYSKAKKDAADAFAELDGKGPASPAPSASGAKTAFSDVLS